MAEDGEEIRWLSGEILTAVNKIVFPAAWLVILVGVPAWVYGTTGQLSVAPAFRFIVAFFLVSAVFVLWFATRVQRVGTSGGDVVVASYFSDARIPLNQVESVDLPWWSKRQIVRIRFRAATPFGTTVYYVPKWAPLRCLTQNLAEELIPWNGLDTR